ncbi:Protein of unknown function [Magnetospirillum sp. XM-1]|uniref:DUF2946 family protein n=1 Tax=Magnetospirillum sp. XM-1 TaxID=1663591 RepID=UPI00073DE341|nr:DUF2946 family protein [Magnetospirillum sp. XM-1]CUW41056.1 Protein of unknown function [Magnetospirillum sp. XM-1]
MGTAKRLGALGRWAAWLAVLALAFQLLLPTGPVQAAAFDQALAASICHSSPESDAQAPAKAVHDHCQFCQLHAGIKLLAPPALSGPALPRDVLFAVVPAADSIGIVHPVHLPQSQRGPPSHS